jgi:hypothetical protein
MTRRHFKKISPEIIHRSRISYLNKDSKREPNDYQQCKKQIAYTTFFSIEPAEVGVGLAERFDKYCVESADLKGILLVLIVLLIYFVTRGSLGELHRLDSRFTVGFAFAVAFFVTKTISIGAYLSPVLSRFVHPGRIASLESFALVCIALSQGFYLLARATEGSCPEGTSTWDQQQCNPASGSHSLPQEQLLAATWSVLIAQVFSFGCSRLSVLLGWVISVVLVNISHQAAGGGCDLWFNVYLLLGMCASYDVMRRKLEGFLTRANMTSIINEANSEIEQLTRRISDHEAITLAYSRQIQSSLQVSATGKDILVNKLSSIVSDIPANFMEIADDIQHGIECANYSLEDCNTLCKHSTSADVIYMSYHLQIALCLTCTLQSFHLLFR